MLMSNFLKDSYLPTPLGSPLDPVPASVFSQELRISWVWAASYPERYLRSIREFAEAHPRDGWTVTMESLAGHMIVRADRRVG